MRPDEAWVSAVFVSRQAGLTGKWRMVFLAIFSFGIFLLIYLHRRADSAWDDKKIMSIP
jgi:hypothetical protein